MTIKARRNRIRLQKRRPRIRMESTAPASPTWVRDRFLDGPTLLEVEAMKIRGDRFEYLELHTTAISGPAVLEAAPITPLELLRPTFRARLRERFRILGWIFRLLRR